MRLCARRSWKAAMVLACAAALAWSLGGGDPAAADSHEPVPVDVPTPDDTPTLDDEDEAGDAEPSRPPEQPAEPAAPAPPPEAQPEPAPAPEEDGPAPAEEEPPPPDVQASGEENAGGPPRPSRGSSYSPLLQNRLTPGSGAQDMLGDVEVPAPMVAEPGVSVAPPASDSPGEDSLGEAVAASPTAALGNGHGGQEPAVPDLAVLTALAAALAWSDRRHRARFRPRP